MKSARFFRTLVAFTLILAMPTVLIIVGTAKAQGDFDWRKYEGTELRFMVYQGPWINSVQEDLEAFQEATGIKVILEVLPEAQFREKIRVEMQGQSDSLDAFLNQTSVLGREFTANGWVEPLDAYIADASKTNEDFEYEADFLEYSKNAVIFEGKIIAIPTDRVLGPMMFYRKDLLEQYNIAVPTTHAELEAAAKQIYEASGGTIVGIVNRGKGAEATSMFAPVMHEFGGRWQDDEGNPTINTPEWIAAAEWYGRVLRETGAEGATAFAFAETVNEFLSGKAAFSLEGGLNPGNIGNPEQSQVVGKVGYAVTPRGTAPESVRSTEPCRVNPPFGLSISAFSKNKDAAWYLVQWMVGKDAQISYLKSGRVAARISAWESQDFADSISDEARGYWEAMSVASQICYPTFGFAPASLIDQGRARNIIGEVLVTSILGGDVKAAAEIAQQELEALKARQ